MARNPESKFIEIIKRDLRLLTGCWFFKTQERARRGIPDIICCYMGLFIAIEAKTDTGRVDKLQDITIKSIVKNGGMSFVTTPSLWPMHFAMLKTLFQPESQATLGMTKNDA